MTTPSIAVDADGVLLDYSAAYARAWERAFGWHPAERDSTAYWPIDRWDVERLTGEPLERFRACFDTEFWSTVPAIDGAVVAANQMHDAGITLVCVSALELHHEAARLRNLRALGFPIEPVVATGTAPSVVSPKAAALTELDPDAFVDDYLPYLRGVNEHIHTALVTRLPTGSPNVGPELASIGSQHVDFRAFAAWWLTGARSGELRPSR